MLDVSDNLLVGNLSVLAETTMLYRLRTSYNVISDPMKVITSS